jgi:hypothetical protein
MIIKDYTKHNWIMWLIIIMSILLIIALLLTGCSKKPTMNTLYIQQSCQEGLNNGDDVQYDGYTIIYINDTYAEFKCTFNKFKNITHIISR